MSTSPSTRPRALSVGADARSQDSIFPPPSIVSPRRMSITPQPKPLAHEIAHHYEVEIENRVTTCLKRIEEVHQQRLNELNTLMQSMSDMMPTVSSHSIPLDHIVSSPNTSLPSLPIPPVPLRHTLPSQPTVTSTPTQTSAQPTRLKASDLPKFYGRDDDDIVEWVQKVGSLKRVFEATDRDILRLLPSLLHELQDRFLPPNRLDDLIYRCIRRYLGQNEKFVTYYEDKVYLQQFLFPANTEDFLLIRDILSGILSTLRAQLQTAVTPNMSLCDFRCHVLQIEPGFRPHLFPSSHRHPADRARHQRNNHPQRSSDTSTSARPFRHTPGTRPDKPCTLCFTCGAYHWSDQCTLKRQQHQQYGARPPPATNNPGSSTSSTSRRFFLSWARPASNTTSHSYQPLSNSVNSIQPKDNNRFNSPKPSINTLLHSHSPAPKPLHALPPLQLQQKHLNMTPAFANIKFNSNHPSALTHRAVIDTAPGHWQILLSRISPG
ncbi:Hypothetical Protein CGB_C5480W [Cryptococcus gattii WM276]|uniref:Uncharacterized protein n=1 Tax=Cryptococcus gattii serotype B (strain WM276 / ATCC MYA-4071) TaxID=367775 RepID=E6R3M6_CRYGW|nr:Hypothetical Protein CGB_C5480W [Cryptococcus gattii WM276]ADV21077.1 Hypothetical Protein CGB_C5480W [Cryptococcus gattii WM276]